MLFRRNCRRPRTGLVAALPLLLLGACDAGPAGPGASGGVQGAWSIAEINGHAPASNGPLGVRLGSIPAAVGVTRTVECALYLSGGVLRLGPAPEGESADAEFELVLDPRVRCPDLPSHDGAARVEYRGRYRHQADLVTFRVLEREGSGASGLRWEVPHSFQLGVADGEALRGPMTFHVRLESGDPETEETYSLGEQVYQPELSFLPAPR